jgi:hypothetical protein
MPGPLLTRDEFRVAVFVRAKYTCVVPNCGMPAADAHHIIERRLFFDEGYYLDNGAALCPDHHIRAEQTLIEADRLREWAGCERLILPPHLYHDQEYDKWANPILPNGLRMRGELFEDESVQRALKPVLHLFTNKVRYPRTHHLPWSEQLTSEDRYMPQGVKEFYGREVVVTEKMDGEQTTMGPDFIHARSLDTPTHPSRSWVRNLHGKIHHEIPPDYRVCGENLYAVHSIKYGRLPSYFMVFNIWRGLTCLSWHETSEWAELLGLVTVPVIYRGEYDERLIKSLWRPEMEYGASEGYVVRTTGEIHYRDWPRRVGKFVRRGHVAQHGHWERNILEKNELQDRDQHVA